MPPSSTTQGRAAADLLGERDTHRSTVLLLAGAARDGDPPAPRPSPRHPRRRALRRRRAGPLPALARGGRQAASLPPPHSGMASGGHPPAQRGVADRAGGGTDVAVRDAVGWPRRRPHDRLPVRRRLGRPAALPGALPRHRRGTLRAAARRHAAAGRLPGRPGRGRSPSRLGCRHPPPDLRRARVAGARRGAQPTSPSAWSRGAPTLRGPSSSRSACRARRTASPTSSAPSPPAPRRSPAIRPRSSWLSRARPSACSPPSPR
jgi:hypothetical protein